MKKLVAAGLIGLLASVSSVYALAFTWANDVGVELYITGNSQVTPVAGWEVTLVWDSNGSAGFQLNDTVVQSSAGGLFNLGGGNFYYGDTYQSATAGRTYYVVAWNNSDRSFADQYCVTSLSPLAIPSGQAEDPADWNPGNDASPSAGWQPIPEPGTLALAVIGGLAAVVIGRKARCK